MNHGDHDGPEDQRRQQGINPTTKGIPEDIAIGLTPTGFVRVLDFHYPERYARLKVAGNSSPQQANSVLNRARTDRILSRRITAGLFDGARSRRCRGAEQNRLSAHAT